jgi:hypothetical protein
MEPVESSEVFQEDPEMAVTELDDGSAIIDMAALDVETESTFDENLAEPMSDQDRLQVGSDLIEAVTRDKESREKRQKQYEDGLRRSGLGDDAPGGAQFNGASRVVHPMLAEACVDFEARAIKELFPSGGPVRTSIISDDDTERLEIATTKRDILNLQLTRLIPEYRDEQESLLSQLPMGGSQYLKMWHDGRRKRVEFIPIDHVFLPFHCTNFYSASRITHQQFITRQEFDARVENGLYIDLGDKPPTAEDLDYSVVDVANNKIEGKDDNDAYNEDGLREVYEIYVDSDYTEWDESVQGVAPYIAHIDVFTEKLVGLYRNWREGDDDFARLDWLVEWGFIPWRGAYKLGLPHLIGGLSAAATGALRALLDSAHAANAPTLLKLKSGRLVGQTTEVAVTQVQEIEGPTGIDDIRKMVSPIPFAGPNPVLFQLMGFLVETGKGVVATAEEKISDVSDRMPVGTSLAMIEQGSKVFSAIHMRLHHSQAKALEVLCRLNADYPETEVWERMLGKKIDPEIFRHTDDISPVSDPNIFSEAQRFAQMQAVMQLMSDATIPYNRIEGHRRMLRLLNVADADKLLPEQPKPKRMEPVAENMAAVSGIPLKAFPDQDHLAHMETHLRFILSPAFGSGPGYGGQQLAPLLAHCGEHLTMYYPQAVAQGQSMALATGHLLPDASPERVQAVGSAAVDTIAQQTLGELLQMLAAAQQLVQKKTPPPPMDPQTQATMQVAQMEDARAKAEFQGKMQLETTKAQGEQMKQAAEMEMKQAALQHQQQMDQIKLEQENRLAMMEAEFRQSVERLKQQVEVQKNDADNAQKASTELRKNEQDNMTNLLVAKMREAVKEETSRLAQAPQQDTGMLEELRNMLTEIERSRSHDALATMTEGLKAMLANQSQHQTRTMELAAKLLAPEV